MNYDEARERQRELEALLNHPGWLRIQLSVEEQIRLRRQEDFNTVIVGMDTVIHLAGGRGEIAGLKLAMALPTIILDDIKADILRMLEEEREKEKEGEGNG
jgi:hypothetical protein